MDERQFLLGIFSLGVFCIILGVFFWFIAHTTLAFLFLILGNIFICMGSAAIAYIWNQARIKEEEKNHIRETMKVNHF